MNQQLQSYARETLKQGLAQLPSEWQLIFKRMYAHNHLEWNINQVVDNMSEDKLDWAMQQVDNSIKKHSANTI